ncbi:MAG: hypothetical protein GWO86_03220, partial [Planctomycetes bacterium]|nr:hypothetical protein [Planctomycetota bacterium]
MQTATKKTILLIMAFTATAFITGCTNWKKSYTALNVEHQNLKGLYDNCRQTLQSSTSEQAAMAQKLAEGQQTIEEMRKQIEERNQTPGEVTGFGDYQVDVDSAAGTVTVTLPNAILFASGKATLKKSAKTDLKYIVSVLNEKYGSRQIDVVGHTDSDP